MTLVDCGATLHKHDYFSKISWLDPRAPLSNKHLFAAASTEVKATVDVMNHSGSQTQICWQKEVHTTTVHQDMNYDRLIFQTSLV